MASRSWCKKLLTERIQALHGATDDGGGSGGSGEGKRSFPKVSPALVEALVTYAQGNH